MGNESSKKGIPPPEKSGYPTQGGASYPSQGGSSYPSQEKKSPQGYPGAPVPPGQAVQPPHYPNQPAYPPAPHQGYPPPASANAPPPPYAPPGAPQHYPPVPHQNPGYPPAQGTYPPHGAPPPQHFQQGGVGYQVTPGQFQPGQQVIVNGGFDAGARFNGSASIPPPPPGCAPNAAQKVTDEMRTRSANGIKRAASTIPAANIPKVAGKKQKIKKADVDAVIPEATKSFTPVVPPPTVPTKTKKGVKKTIDISPPENWEVLYRNIQEMRSKADAPVDTMGCTELYSGKATEVEKRFQILISLLMSSQTKDEVNAGAMKRLNEHFKSFSAEDAATANESLLSELITPVGFHKTKSKNIVKVGAICRDQYGGDIPDTIENLVKLPGIGPKMGYLALSCAWGKNDGIGVDVHVHRICQRLCFTKKPKDPEATRAQLESWLPKDKWQEINKLLVGFGQQICSAKAPQCSNCLNNAICPKNFSGEKNSPKK